jgi:hypothetical protein
MPTISFRCIEETSEVSDSDSPYFLVYAGDSQKQKSDVRLVRNPLWDDEVDAGETRSKSVDFTVGGFDLVLVALLEEDWDNDFITDGKVKKIRETMNNLDTLLQPAVLETQLPEFTMAFNNAIKKNCVNDDLIRMRRVFNNQTLNFTDGAASYNVKFKV